MFLFLILSGLAIGLLLLRQSERCFQKGHRKLSVAFAIAAAFAPVGPILLLYFWMIFALWWGPGGFD
ncbi:MAG: hypothetical protein IAG10_17500 [Planctomycetaceae bacterium]|nr:hypothetical protein [Planctomycetaceae bacterium]